MEKLKGKIFIAGEIHITTGLHIGGSKGGIEVGEVDNNVIKTSEGLPYIPGSSLKGALRASLEKIYSCDMMDNKTKIFTDPKHFICKIFGVGASSDSTPSRLITRDAFLKNNIVSALKTKSGQFQYLSEPFTETKHENVMNRQTGGTATGGLREIERVPAGSIFVFDMIYDVYEKTDIENLKHLFVAFNIVKDSYIGGSGTRGYGKHEYQNITISGKNIKAYESGELAPIIAENQNGFDFTFNTVKDNLLKYFFDGSVQTTGK